MLEFQKSCTSAIMVLGAKILISQMAHDMGEYPFNIYFFYTNRNLLEIAYMNNLSFDQIVSNVGWKCIKSASSNGKRFSKSQIVSFISNYNELICNIMYMMTWQN